MHTRFAIRVTDELLEMGSKLSGMPVETEDSTPLYVLLEHVSPRKFVLEFCSEDEVLEQFKNDPDLEII